MAASKTPSAAARTEGALALLAQHFAGADANYRERELGHALCDLLGIDPSPVDAGEGTEGTTADGGEPA